MRVLRVSAGLDPVHGGPPLSTLNSTLAVAARADVAVELAVIDEGRPTAEATDRLEAAGVGVHAFPLARIPGAYRFSISIKMLFWLVRHVRSYDVVHAHGGWTASSLGAILAARLFRRPVVLTPHESLTEHDRGQGKRYIKQWLRRFYLRRVDAIVFASELERTESAAAHVASAYVVAHPVAQEVAGRDGDQRRGRLRVGFLGRLHPKKNLEMLMRAMPVTAELLVAGDGPPALRDALATVASSAGISERVTWIGFVDGREKERFFLEIDVLAMPSRFECFGMAAAEALAAGVPVLVSSSCGIAPLVDRYKCGVVVEPTEEAIRAALSDPSSLLAGAETATVAVAAELSLEAHAEQIVLIYRNVTSPRRG